MAAFVTEDWNRARRPSYWRDGRAMALWRPRLKDPADEMVLETAVNGEADRLVTFNLRHLAIAARDLSIRATAPGEFWKELQRRNEKK